MTSPCYQPTGDFTSDYDQMRRLMALPLDMKVVYSKTLIQKYYIENKGKVYVGFSGGKDSTVLLHLVRSKYPEVPAVYFDTGMGFPENRRFVKTFDNVVFVKPTMNFKEVLDKYGYPCIGKNQAHYIGLAQRGFPSGIRQMNADSKFGYVRYKWMVNAPFKVSEKCCEIMKKKPAVDYNKQTGRVPIIGTRVEESTIRETTFLKHGETHNTHGLPMLTPLSIWTSKDIDNYIAVNKIPLSECYTKLGYERTGCMFCMFGIMSDPNRFLKLKNSHPAIWTQCMKPREKGGLGMKEVLEYMSVPTGCEQTNLKDFSTEGEA